MIHEVPSEELYGAIGALNHDLVAFALVSALNVPSIANLFASLACNSPFFTFHYEVLADLFARH